ncbi:hypothetical protein QFZ64_004411 [Streptomyces sp. B3I8]|nr:hypothetical protein [Streptomyces sp. B3I8]
MAKDMGAVRPKERGARAPHWEPGTPILWRYRENAGPRIHIARPVTVVRDDEELLAVWLAPGTECVRPALADGSPVHREPLATRYTTPRTTHRDRWFGTGVLKLARPGEPWSVWLFWEPGWRFKNWYVNLEEPLTRWSGGVDSEDHFLDLCVYPDPHLGLARRGRVRTGPTRRPARRGGRRPGAGGRPGGAGGGAGVGHTVRGRVGELAPGPRPPRAGTAGRLGRHARPGGPVRAALAGAARVGACTGPHTCPHLVPGIVCPYTRSHETLVAPPGANRRIVLRKGAPRQHPRRAPGLTQRHRGAADRERGVRGTDRPRRRQAARRCGENGP